MRKCPKCGYRDPQCWRHHRWLIYNDYCHLSELKNWDKELAETLAEKKDVILEGYIYHVNKLGYVHRIHVSDSKDGKSWRSPDTEKSLIKRFAPQGQQKLS